MLILLDMIVIRLGVKGSWVQIPPSRQCQSAGQGRSSRNGKPAFRLVCGLLGETWETIFPARSLVTVPEKPVQHADG